MDKFATAPKASQKQSGPGHCRVCSGVHDYRCAFPGCDKTGTITASTNHQCAGQVHWYCSHHFHDR